jgi:protein SCO1/2
VTGVTGPKEEIDRVVRQYGASYEFVDSGSAAGRLVNHTTRLYLIDPQGRLRQALAHDVPAEAIAARIQEGLR